MNLSRTAKAIEEYDNLQAQFERFVFTEVGGLSDSEWQDFLRREAQFALRVVEAYGEDTRSINNPKTCAQCVRPGPAVPSVGSELSFVRRMVNAWHDEQEVDGSGH